jgi:hypothetical protein
MTELFPAWEIFFVQISMHTYALKVISILASEVCVRKTTCIVTARLKASANSPWRHVYTVLCSPYIFSCRTSICTINPLSSTLNPLLHRRIHIQLLTIPPSPLHRIRTHFHARPHAPRFTTMCWENLFSYYQPYSIHYPSSIIQSAFPPLSLSLCLSLPHTLVPDHPSLNAASFATNSPNPSIRPFTNGSKRLIAAPRTRPQSVGGL